MFSPSIYCLTESNKHTRITSFCACALLYEANRSAKNFIQRGAWQAADTARGPTRTGGISAKERAKKLTHYRGMRNRVARVGK